MLPPYDAVAKGVEGDGGWGMGGWGKKNIDGIRP